MYDSCGECTEKSEIYQQKACDLNALRLTGTFSVISKWRSTNQTPNTNYRQQAVSHQRKGAVNRTSRYAT